MFRNSKLCHIYLNFKILFTSYDFERQQLPLENWRLLKRNTQAAKIIHTQDQAHDKWSVLTLSVKKFLLLVQPLNIIFNEASDEEGKLNYLEDLDVLIIKWLLVTQVDWLFLSLLSLHLCFVSISFDLFQVKSVKMRLLFTPCWRLLNNNKIQKTEWFGEDEQESPYKNFEILDCDILWYGKYTFLKNLLYHWFSCRLL